MIAKRTTTISRIRIPQLIGYPTTMSSQDRLQQHQALNGTTKRSGIGDPKSTGLSATNLLTVSLDQADSTISSESKVRPDPKTTSASHSRQTSASDAFAHGHTDREPTFDSQSHIIAVPPWADVGSSALP